MLAALANKLTRRNGKRIAATSLGDKSGSGSDQITVEALYPRWAEFLKPGDIVIAEIGTPRWGSASH